MRARIFSLLLAGVAAWGAAGCGDTDSNGAGDRDQFLAQLCDELAPCCEAAGRPADGAQCRAFYSAFVGSAGYDQAAADACLTEFRARKDACDTSTRTAPSCGKVFSTTSGTKQPGEACDSESDCAASDEGDVECESDYIDGATVQQCQVRIPGTAGSAPCVGTVDGNVTYYSGARDGIPAKGYLCDVADGLSCDSTTGACKALAAVGEACTGECVPSAYCEFATGVCQERLAIGSACQNDDDCVAKAFCAASTKVCTAALASGAACESSAECESKSCTNQKCASDGLNDLSLALLCGTN